MKSPILGSAYVPRSVNAADNRMINLFPEVLQEGKEAAYLQRVPGLVLRATLGVGPIRGMNAFGDYLYVASGSSLYRVDQAYNSTVIGTIANDGPVGLGRFTTLRSWLSQWSYDESRANGVVNAQRISCPVLVINNTADLACTPSHAQRLFDAVGSKDKEIVQIKDADHYYVERRDLLPTAVATVADWLARHGF